jgi:hypothetical protein
MKKLLWASRHTGVELEKQNSLTEQHDMQMGEMVGQIKETSFAQNTSYSSLQRV